MRVPPVVSVLLGAVVVGSLAFYVDLHNDEVQPAALILLVGSGLIGAAWPKWSWLAGLISGVCITVGHFAYRAAGGAPPFPIEPNPFAALVAIIPATIGALIGAGARVMFRSSDVKRS